MAHTEDWFELAQEVIAEGRRLAERMERFAESIEHIHEQMNEQAEQEVRKFRGEILDTVCMADMISTAVNTAYAAGRSDRGPGATASCQ